MREKIKIIGAIMFLFCLIIGCAFGGEALYDHMERGEATAGNAKSRNAPLVIVDAGHGGKDSGKVGTNEVLEKDINLKIAAALKNELEKRDIEVVMTREDDERLGDTQTEDLKERVSIINESKPDLTVSIHQNSYHEASVHGSQAFYFTHSAEAKSAAGMIQKAMESVDEQGTREAKANDTYYLLKKTEVPVVIMECGFLSNYEEAEKLATEEYQQAVAEAIAEGVVKYLESR